MGFLLGMNTHFTRFCALYIDFNSQPFLHGWMYLPQLQLANDKLSIRLHSFGS